MKKAVQDAKQIFKYIIWIILVVFTLFLGYKVINNIVGFLKMKNLVDLKLDIENYISSENDQPFFVNYNVKYICFSNSIRKEELKKFGIKYQINENLIKNFKNYEILESLMENGQAPLIIVFEDGSWKHFYIKNLLISPKPLPYCIPKGKAFIVKDYLGFKTIEEYKGNNFDYK